LPTPLAQKAHAADSSPAGGGLTWAELLHQESLRFFNSIYILTPFLSLLHFFIWNPSLSSIYFPRLLPQITEQRRLIRGWSIPATNYCVWLPVFIRGHRSQVTAVPPSETRRKRLTTLAVMDEAQQLRAPPLALLALASCDAGLGQNGGR
jgi:hypothetical protein